MYRVCINDETKKDVDVNFNEAYEYLIEKGWDYNKNMLYCLEYFHDAINEFMKLYPNLKDSIDVLADYRYYVSCETEEQAEEVEAYFDNKFEDAQDIIYDIVDDLEELAE